MDKSAVATILDEMGTLLELQGANPFKSRAFHNAARSVEAITESIETLVSEDRLQEVKGIGSSIGSIIKDLVTSGKSSEYESLRSSLPAGLLEMLKIEGLGPKRIKLLYDELHIDSIASLEKAAREDKLAKIKGLGEKSQEKILAGIGALRQRSGKTLFSTAERLAAGIMEYLRKQKGVQKLEVAGSLRRKKEVVGDIDLLAVVELKNRTTVMKAFTGNPSVERVLGQGETKSSVLLTEGIQCDLRLVEEDEFPFALQYFTGSKEHNVELRTRARKMGWSLNEYGFTPIEGNKGSKGGKKHPPKCSDEEAIYRSLGLSYVEPELREANGEIESAEKGTLPELIDVKDLRGTFHCHTTYSDGLHTLEQMAHAAKALGWEYLGIADHSKVAAYAHGLSKADVLRQFKEIDALNAKAGVHLFKGTECDILPNGDLDWPATMLAEFDYVVVSVHSSFKMSEKEMTARIIKGLKQKNVTMLGHPTGRLLLSRDAYPVSMTDVLKAASDYGKMIEINAYPNRLDLDWRLCRPARDAGIMIAINPDAHRIEDLSYTRFGVNVARKGWLKASDVLNTRSLKGVDAALHGTVERSHDKRKQR